MLNLTPRNDGLGTIPAETVTDVPIEIGREYSEPYDRMIVHYM